MDKNREQPEAASQSAGCSTYQQSRSHRAAEPVAWISSNTPDSRIAGKNVPTDDEWMEDNIRFLTKVS